MPVDPETVADRLAELVPHSGRIAVGDAAGFPAEAWPGVVDLLVGRPDVQALLGWCLATPDRIDELTAAQVRTLVSGFGMRRPIDAGQVAFVPARLGTVAALMCGALRPDVVVVTLRPVAGGYAFTTEVSWQRAAIAAGARIAAVVNHAAPKCDSGESIAAAEVTVLGECERTPLELRAAVPTEVQCEIAERVAALVPDGARMQVGPGGLGAAVYGALLRPVAVDTGLVTDPVADLDRRGLLDGLAFAPYVTGTELVYEWCPGRVRLAGFEVTHDPGRLVGGRPLVSVNTGLEIDLSGQVNAESGGGSAVGGVGGQPDYAAAAAASVHGLSIIAMAGRDGSGRPTLVRELQAPVTTPSHDVDIVVTEHGAADVRGLSRSERAAALSGLWSHQHN